MIFYFSGTGNSRFIAKKIGEILEDDIESINLLLKRQLSTEFTSEKPYVFVLPTYAWRIPRVVENLIKKATFNGSKKWYFIMTCGSSIGNSEKYLRRLSNLKEMEFLGVAQIKMPENYIALFDIPEEAKIKALIQEGEKQAVSIAQTIKGGNALDSKELTVKDKFLSKIVNPVFYKLIVKSDDFYVKDTCIGCHKCQNICPTNNIYMKDNNRPAWKHKCTHCMACISICPTKSIEYEGRTEKKGRYYLE